MLAVIFDAKEDNTIIWDILKNKTIKKFKSINFSWDTGGKHFAFGDFVEQQYYIRIWDIETDSELTKIHIRLDYISNIVWEPGEKRLISTGRSIQGKWFLKQWQITKPQNLRAVEGHSSPTLSAIPMVGDSKQDQLICSAEDKSLRIIDLATGKTLPKTTKDYPVSMRNISCDSKGERLVSSGQDHRVRVWNIASGKQLYQFEGDTAHVKAVTWDHAGSRLASGGADTILRISDAKAGEELQQLIGHQKAIRSVAWDAKDERIASGGDDQSVRVWVVDSGKLLHEFKGHTAPIVQLAWSPKKLQIASASWDKTVRVWDAASGKPVAECKGHTVRVTGVAWDHTGEYLASCSEDKTIRVWRASTGECVHQIELPQEISHLVWRETEAGSMIAAVFAHQVAGYCISFEGPKVSSTLSWLNTHEPVLHLEGVDMSGAVMDPMTHGLLKERGAVGEAKEIVVEEFKTKQKAKTVSVTTPKIGVLFPASSPTPTPTPGANVGISASNSTSTTVSSLIPSSSTT